MSQTITRLADATTVTAMQRPDSATARPRTAQTADPAQPTSLAQADRMVKTAQSSKANKWQVLALGAGVAVVAGMAMRGKTLGDAAARGLPALLYAAPLAGISYKLVDKHSGGRTHAIAGMSVGGILGAGTGLAMKSPRAALILGGGLALVGATSLGLLGEIAAPFSR